MTWEIIKSLIEIAAFCISIVTIGWKLNGTLTRLSCSIDALSKDRDRAERTLEEQGKTLENHEVRIVKLEHKED